MWMIRFIQYPRNSVENLNRALYIKLLKIQWLSASKSSPSPRGGREDDFSEKHTEWNRKNNLYNFIYYYNFYICLIYFCLFSCCSLCNFLIRIPEDILNQEFLQTRALCKFSTEFLGCWTNRIVTHIGDVRLMLYYIGTNGNRKCQANFLWMTKL